MAQDISNVNSAVGFTQAATILNSIVNQATGKANLTATSTAEFVSQAQTALKIGTEPLLNALSTVLSKTIFSVRPYSAKFKGLQRDAVQWGNHVRKINYSTDGMSNIDKYDLTNGYSDDQQIVKKPTVLQTNWYSFDSYQDYITIPDDQLNTAFTGPDEFMRFISGIMTSVSNKHEAYKENFARMTLANYIAATASMSRVRHLLTEFATEYSIMDSATPPAPDPTAVLPTYLDKFVKWLFAELKVLSARFEERSLLYHSNPTGYDIYRHTPKAQQRLYIYSPFLAQVDASVLSAAFNPSYLNLGEREEVSFWQSINTPDTINITPSILKANGEYQKAGSAYNKQVLGILMDYEGAGVTTIDEHMEAAPHNARGRYTTIWYGASLRGWNDLTENSIVLALD